MAPRTPRPAARQAAAVVYARVGKLDQALEQLEELLRLEEAKGEEGFLRVAAVLESLPGTGKVKAKRIMEQHGIAINRRLRGLGTRQREVLLELFG